MSIIYTPKGKAREYSPAAANFYEGCDHRCVYCYAPGIRRKTREQYAETAPRRDILGQLHKDCKKNAYSKQQVLLNFMGDPYCNSDKEHQITRNALKMFLEYKIPVAVLTKGGERAARDFDIMHKFGNHFKLGATLTFYDKQKSIDWEPGAATPQERFNMLEQAHKEGIKTWASFEPVIDPAESIKCIKETINYVDEYKIGKLNNYKGMDKAIDWASYLESVVNILRENDKPFYIKHDLRRAAPFVKLYGNEVLPDEFNLEPFDKMELFR